MQDYLVISVLDKNEDKLQSLLTILHSFFRMRGARVVLVANGSDIDRITFAEKKVLPFTAFVSGPDSLNDALEKEESLIFYDTVGKDVAQKTMEIMQKTRLNIVMTIGDDTKIISKYSKKNSSNVIRTLMVSAFGERVFLYPEALGQTRENVIDSLIQVDSLTHDGHFSSAKPIAMITNGDDGINYEEISIIAKHMGMNLELVPADPLPRLAQYDAILAFGNPGYEPSLLIRFGFPFAYMNAPLQLPMAFKTALEAMEIFGA